MIKKNKKYFFIILINIITCGYLFNPEHLGLAGSGSTAYNNLNSSNPASISKHLGLSVQIFGSSFGLGNNFFLYQIIMTLMVPILMIQNQQIIFLNLMLCHYLIMA